MAKSRLHYLVTSESVTEGHPDKIADQISDAVLDAVLTKDPTGRVACECLLTTGLALVAGEITTRAVVDYPTVVRNTIKELGYTDARYGLDCESCSVLTAIHEQSPDIAMGVDPGGAGDQGMMIGYASDESEELMPLPILLAHKLTRRLTQCRKEGLLEYLRPDGKSQVTVEYEGDQPVRVDTVVISAQHAEQVRMEQLRRDVMEQVIKPVLPSHLSDQRIKFHVNPTGRFVCGGPHGDTGLTGRKIIVDTYGGVGRHGGGAFSGKDPSKVDRSAAYMARYIAKNLVAAELARRAEVQLAYAIGVAEPVSVMVDTFETGAMPEDRLVELVRDTFSLTPLRIIDHLQLRRPIYRRTAAYGHFGRTEPEFTWERTDKVADLRSAAGVPATAQAH